MSDPEVQPDLAQRRFLKKLAGTAAGVAGFAAASRLLSPTTAEAAYSNGTAPDGGDLVNTSLWVQGNLTVQGPRPWIDVRAYGAIGDGVANDTVAIQNAFNAVPGPPFGGTVFLPAGQYRVLGPITCTDKHVSVLGTGRVVSEIRWDAAGGLHFSFSHPAYRMSLQSLALTTTTANAGVGLKVTYPFWPGGEPSSPHVSDVFIGPNGGVGYWSKGIEMANAAGTRIHDFDIIGQTTPLNMTHGIHMLGTSSIVNIHAGHILLPGIGVLIEGISEGAYISDVEAVVANIGFYLDSPEGMYPGTAIRDCHTAAFHKGIFLYQHNDVAVTGNLIYQQATVENNNWVGIDVISSPYTRIIGNNLHGGSNTRNGIILGGSSSNCTIQGNVVRAMHTGIWLTGGGSDNNVVIGNRIENPTVTSILDSGAGNLIANNL